VGRKGLADPYHGKIIFLSSDIDTIFIVVLISAVA